MLNIFFIKILKCNVVIYVLILGGWFFVFIVYLVLSIVRLVIIGVTMIEVVTFFVMVRFRLCLDVYISLYLEYIYNIKWWCKFI